MSWIGFVTILKAPSLTCALVLWLAPGSLQTVRKVVVDKTLSLDSLHAPHPSHELPTLYSSNQEIHNLWFGTRLTHQPLRFSFLFFASTLSGAGGEYDFDTYGKGSMKHFTFTGGELPPAWWAFDFVANWMELSYQNMSETYIYPRVHSLQQEVAKEAALAVAMSSKTDSNASAAKLLSKTQTRLQRQVVKTWWELAAKMVVRYNDMFFNFPERAPTEVLSVGYPAFWLEMVGFNQESYRPTWMAPAARPPMLLNLQSNAALAALQPAPNAVGNDVRILVAGAFGALLLGIVVGNTIGYKHGWRDAVKSGNQQDAVYHHM